MGFLYKDFMERSSNIIPQTEISPGSNGLVLHLLTNNYEFLVKKIKELWRGKTYERGNKSM